MVTMRIFKGKEKEEGRQEVIEAVKAEVSPDVLERIMKRIQQQQNRS